MSVRIASSFSELVLDIAHSLRLNEDYIEKLKEILIGNEAKAQETYQIWKWSNHFCGAYRPEEYLDIPESRWSSTNSIGEQSNSVFVIYVFSKILGSTMEELTDGEEVSNQEWDEPYEWFYQWALNRVRAGKLSTRWSG